MSALGSNSEDDIWRDDISTAISTTRRSKATKAPVRDSWDEDEDVDETTSDSKLIWEQENAKAPMPQIQLSTTTVVSGTTLPPLAAFKEPLKILKRPESKAKSPPTSSPNSQTAKSLEEREAQYRAARQRIFGDKQRERDKDPVLVALSQPPTGGPSSAIIREPIGPPVGNQSSNFKQGWKKGGSLVTTPQDSKNMLDTTNDQRTN